MPDCVIVAVNDIFDLLIEVLTCNCELHIAVVADKQLKSQLFFHVCNVLAHGGLCNKAFLGSTSKIQAFCGTDKIFKSSDIQKRAPPFYLHSGQVSAVKAAGIIATQDR